MTHTRGYPAIIATLVLALAFAACGSDDNASNSAAGGGSTSSNSGDAAGIAKAQQRLKPFETTPTEINSKEPLKGAPPTGKSLIFLGTNDPNNQKLQKSLKELAALAKWKYDIVSYDPANPSTLNAAIDTAITKKANYIAEAGIPPTPAMCTRHASPALAIGCTCSGSGNLSKAMCGSR